MSEPEDEPGWMTNVEKLRCLIVLDDGAAALLSPRAGVAYFRAFIVEDRVTGAVTLKFRYRYKDPDERSWSRVTMDKRGDGAIEFFRQAIEKVLREGARRIGLPLPKDAIQAFYPPDDGGDVTSTLIWLEMRDLIEITEITQVRAEAKP
jgi:hypothetical protein